MVRPFGANYCALLDINTILRRRLLLCMNRDRFALMVDTDHNNGSVKGRRALRVRIVVDIHRDPDSYRRSPDLLDTDLKLEQVTENGRNLELGVVDRTGDEILIGIGA